MIIFWGTVCHGFGPHFGHTCGGGEANEPDPAQDAAIDEVVVRDSVFDYNTSMRDELLPRKALPRVDR